jgi:hypothetical protein
MKRRVATRNIPGRFVTGAYIAHAGKEKWASEPDRAKGVHGMAAGAFPVLEQIPAERFIKVLAAGKLATGALLLNPFTSDATAGVALTGFSGALLAMYLRTPALHKPGSIWPSPTGTAVSKDIWMFGIGLGLLADALTSRRRSRG